MNKPSIGLALLLGLGFVAPACRPTYPKCDKDEHCQKGEFCVQGRCQQCRDNADCAADHRCNKGICEPAGACTGDADCSAGQLCREGKCVKGCSSDDQCPEGQECQQGRCVAPPAPVSKAPCVPDTVYFDFNEYVLTTDAVDALARANECIRRVKQGTLRMEGHCDPRGTEEYNLALGDRRARSVMKHLERLGSTKQRLRPVSKGKLEAQGTDEPGWARDRKVAFTWE